MILYTDTIHFLLQALDRVELRKQQLRIASKRFMERVKKDPKLHAYHNNRKRRNAANRMKKIKEIP